MNIQFWGKSYSTGDLIKYRRRLTKDLRQKIENPVSKKMLILSGSTIGELAEQLEMFCLEKGVQLTIKQGDFGRYYEDAVFGNSELESENYDCIYVHVTSRNLTNIPEPCDTADKVVEKLQAEKNKINEVISSLQKKYSCPIIHNNYELFPYRPMGNREAWDDSGLINFINTINHFLNVKAREDKNLYINDMNYLSAYYGLKQWSEPSYWYRYKYAMCIDAIPFVAQNLSALFLSLCGINRKTIALDLDNTLWGGVIGDDGVDNIIIGNDTANGEAYVEFQKYIKLLSKTGLLLGVVSKNDEQIAKRAFERSEMVLKQEDFAAFIANWNPKSENLKLMAKKLNLGIDSFVFIDDSCMERDEVSSSIAKIGVPILTEVSHFIQDIEECHFFEVANRTDEDRERTNYYLQNEKREEEKKKYNNYDEYLESLEMEWNFSKFKEESFDRIVQLTNKTNQFNLTTLRMNMGDIVLRSSSPEEYICIQGSMKDKFGDNGLVTVLMGKIQEDTLEIENWLMSCRVFRRNGEYRLFDYLVIQCKERNISKIIGTYKPTEKNVLVKEFYKTLGFQLIEEFADGSTVYEYTIL
ncbi:MAG: HAD-IIIC family phosphatase [Lachnospiraceae bacterium]|nr:HAD-IIIC family phosphatase [Lachnospiraceae bacterium]